MNKQVRLALILALFTAGKGMAGEIPEQVKLHGDSRFRLENIQEEGTHNRTRGRLRIRAGVYWEVNEDIDSGIRMATGDLDDPSSRNQTMGDAFSAKRFSLDLAYIDWHPSEWVENLDVILGKMRNPFITPGKYIWDGDVTPEGGAVKYSIGENLKLIVNGGAFWVVERKTENDMGMYAGQLAVQLKPTDKVNILIGGSYYYYENIKGFSVLLESYGNSTVNLGTEEEPQEVYAENFGVAEGFSELQFNAGLPVKIYGSYINNTEADDNNTGYLVGAKLGKAKAPKSYELGYNYRKLEADSTVGIFADSDTWGGGTDGDGHKFYVKYQMMKNWQAAITYLLDKKGLDKEIDYKRLQIDLVAKF